MAAKSEEARFYEEAAERAAPPRRRTEAEWRAIEEAEARVNAAEAYHNESGHLV